MTISKIVFKYFLFFFSLLLYIHLIKFNIIMNEKSSFSVWGVKQSTETNPRQSFQPRMPNYRPRQNQNHYQQPNNYMPQNNMMMDTNNNIPRYTPDHTRQRFPQEQNIRQRNIPQQDGYVNMRPKNLKDNRFMRPKNYQSQDNFAKPRFRNNYDQPMEMEDNMNAYAVDNRHKHNQKRFDGPV